MFDDDAVNALRDDLTPDDDTSDTDPLDDALSDLLGNDEPDDDETETEDDDESAEDDETEDDDEESEDDDEETEDEDDEWPKTIAGRTFLNQAAVDKALEDNLRYLDSTAKDQRVAPAAVPAPSLTGLGGEDHESQFRALPEAQQNIINGAVGSAFPVDPSVAPDFTALESIATQLFYDNDLNSTVGIALSRYVFDMWANSSIENARKASQMEMYSELASLKAQMAVEDPALASVRAQQVSEQASALTQERLAHLDEAGFVALGEWIDANRAGYDESSVDFNDPEQRAGLAEFYYTEMLKAQAMSGGILPATKPAAKRRKGNKAAASTSVKSGVTTDTSPLDDFKKSIMDADINDGRFTWK